MEVGTKSRILYLSKFLFEHTDETHQITTNELIEQLIKEGFSANRKTVMHDIKTLTFAGHDIIVSNTGKNSFFYGNRDFEMPEIKILIEAVSSSHHLTQKQSVKLIKNYKN